MSDYSDCDEPGAHDGIVDAISRIKLSGSSDESARVSGAQPGESPLRDVSNRCSHSNGHLNSSASAAASPVSTPQKGDVGLQSPDQLASARGSLLLTPGARSARSARILESGPKLDGPDEELRQQWLARGHTRWSIMEGGRGQDEEIGKLLREHNEAKRIEQPERELDQENATSPAAPSFAASSSVSVAAPSSKKLAPSSFNHWVRQAKAAEERGDLQRALVIYRDTLAPMRPELETIAKKVRIIAKKIKKAQRESREQQEEEEQEEAEQAPEEAPAAPSAASSSSSSAASEPRMLPLVLDGKFAFDAANARYIVVRPMDGQSASDSDVCAMERARATGELSSDSEMLSAFSLPASQFDRIYPYQQEGIHWLYNHIHCPAPVAASAAFAIDPAAAPSAAASSGGILGDDMGMGKTVSTAVFLSGLFSCGLIRRALVIVPISVLEHWRAEILRWCGAQDDEEEIAAAKGKGSKMSTATTQQKKGLRLLSVYVGKRTPKQRAASELALTQLLASPASKAIVLTTYGQFGAKPELFSAFAPHSGSRWDYVVADEAHKLKNPDTQLHQKLHALPAAHRLLLTGTPIMNDLDELWALMDLACSGLVFGSRKQFKTDWAARIMAGLAKCATTAEKEIGAQLTRKLKERMGPYMLRREKAHVKHQMSECKREEQQKPGAEDEQDAEADPAAAAAGSSIPRSLSASSTAAAQSILPRLSTQKNDLIIWLHLSALQETLYRKFLSNDSVRSVFTTKSRGPLPALTALKKLCDHPRMLDAGMAYMESIGEDLHALDTLPGVTVPTKPVPAAALSGAVVSSSSRTKEIPQATSSALAEPGRPQLASAVRMLCAESAKYACLGALLRMHMASGHRTLIFSQSLRMLGFITLLLAHLQMKSLRIDGTVSDPAERQRRVDLFNRDTSFHAFLLTTRSGAVGLNLTGASRVVIFDPDWTPSLDNQAVDRAYRIGQQRNVVVYRLISCGTVEEVIYRKQVFKGSIIRAATGVNQQAGAAAVPVRAGSDPSAASSSASAVTDETPTRYFGKDELREVFLFKSSSTSSAFDSLRRLHPPSQRRTYAELDAHTREIEAIPGVHGITDHDLMFEQTAIKPEELAAQDAAAAAATAQAVAAANVAAALAAESGDLDALSSSMLDDLSQPLPSPAALSQLERKEDIEAIVAAATSRLDATIGAPRTPPRAKRTKQSKHTQRKDGAEESKETEETDTDASTCDDSESTSSTPSQTGTITECDDRSVRGSPMESPPGGLAMHDDDGSIGVDDGSANAFVSMAPLLDESIIDLTGADEGVQEAVVPDRVLVKSEADIEEKQEERLEEHVQELDDAPAIDAEDAPIPFEAEAEAEADAVDPDVTLPYNKPEADADSEFDFTIAVVPALQQLPVDGEEKENERDDADFVLVSAAEADVPDAHEAMDSTLPYDAPAPVVPVAAPLPPSAAITDALVAAHSDPDASADCTLPFHPPSPGFIADAGSGAVDRPSVVFDLSLPSIRSSFASPGAADLLQHSALCSESAVPVLPAIVPSSPVTFVPAPAASTVPAVRAASISAPVILQLDDSSDDEQDDGETEAQQFEDAREWKEKDDEQTDVDEAVAAMEAHAQSYSDLIQRASTFDSASAEGRLLQLECLLHAFSIDRSDPDLQLRIFRLATETGLVALLPVA